MRLRALLVLFVLFPLLAGFTSIPTAPTLVCDMTGLPVSAAPATRTPSSAAAASRSCCAHQHHAALLRAQAERALSARSLERASCCHLRQSPLRAASPALVRDGTSPLVVLSTPLRLPVADCVTLPAALPFALQPAPRGPPDCRLPSRAPPVLS